MRPLLVGKEDLLSLLPPHSRLMSEHSTRGADRF